MRILILNWRDSKNPDAGGAELLTHELAKRWANKHTVFQLSSRFAGCYEKETIDGVTIMRNGTWWTVQLWAAWYYYTGKWGAIDVVIDEVHWFPFFARLYAKEKTVLLACEVASTLFFKLFPYPVAFVGRMIEKLYLLCYKTTPTIAISASTRDTLVAHGFSPQTIKVIKLGNTVPAKIGIAKKDQNPTIMFLGRLHMLKGIYDILPMFVKVKNAVPDARLFIAGYGSKQAVETVRVQIQQHGLMSSVTLFGPISVEKKFALLNRAHILVVPSIHEGWGLVVTEAGYVKTPAVAYNVPGLRDIVEPGKTGLLVEPNPAALADGVLELLASPRLLKKLSENAHKQTHTLNWDETANQALSFIEKNIDCRS